MTRIAFSWLGLPQYAARLIRGAVDRLDEECVVIGSRPYVPIEGMEEVMNCPILWVDEARPARWADLGLEVPAIFVQSGWSFPAFAALGHEVKAKGGRVIGLSDSNWRGDFRQIVLAPVAFRLLLRKRFDAMLVPGRQGQRLMRWFGMPEDRVRPGMYGADPALFNGGAPLPQRPKTFLFVGQFVARKNVLALADAFIAFSQTRPDWTLELIGAGEQRDLLPQHERIHIKNFLQPEQLNEHFRQARFLVLPSFTEHWGLVVHEAASCGCGLVLSDRVGSVDDLATERNAVCFKAGRKGDLLRALHAAAAFDDSRLAAAEADSRKLASGFGPERFGREIADLIGRISG